MNEKILKIMALALEISPCNENRLYTSKPRVTVEYSTAAGVPTIRVEVTRCYERRETVTKESICPFFESETRLDEIIEWLESVKAEG